MLLTAAAARAALAGQGDTIVETHLHLFDPARFPYHPNATYRPPAETLPDYARFAAEAGISHAVIVHPEPYQDDHSYLEHCFQNEPSPGFFKGTCLFDPTGADTPARMEALVKRLPGRIVALRVHVNRDPKTPPATSGAIRDRDLRHPAMKDAWRAAARLGLAVQMHFIPYYAPQIRSLASEFRDVMVILDHLGKPGLGTPAEYDEVLKLAELPRVIFKYSAVRYSSKQDYPHRDVKPFVRRAWDAFGPDRIIWGVLGMNVPDFRKQSAMLNEMFEFASEGDRKKIRGQNAMRLYRFGRQA
jgi:predicted TIM-barrel fold metal-dependent hydrolase